MPVRYLRSATKTAAATNGSWLTTGQHSTSEDGYSNSLCRQQLAEALTLVRVTLEHSVFSTHLDALSRYEGSGGEQAQRLVKHHLHIMEIRQLSPGQGGRAGGGEGVGGRGGNGRGGKSGVHHIRCR